MVSRVHHYCSTRRPLLLHPRSNSGTEHIPQDIIQLPPNNSTSFHHSTHSIPAETNHLLSRANIIIYILPEGSLPTPPESSIFGKAVLCDQHMPIGCAQISIDTPSEKK